MFFLGWELLQVKCFFCRHHISPFIFACVYQYQTSNLMEIDRRSSVKVNTYPSHQIVSMADESAEIVSYAVRSLSTHRAGRRSLCLFQPLIGKCSENIIAEIEMATCAWYPFHSQDTVIQPRLTQKLDLASFNWNFRSYKVFIGCYLPPLKNRAGYLCKHD